MGESIQFMLLLQLILIGLNAIFASAEIAVLTMNSNRLEKLASEGNKGAKRLIKLTSQPAKFLATIQVAITLSGFLGSAFAADNFSDSIVNWLIGLGVKMPHATLDSIAVIMITLILSYFTLVFGELVPKRFAMRKAESLALAISGLINIISIIFAPIVWFLSISTNAVLRIVGIDPDEEEEQISEEEIRMLVDAGSKKGTIDQEENEFIQNVFEFDDLTAEEVATHRTDVDFLWLEESMEVWAKTINETRHTYYPICEDSVDHIIGILNAKDYLHMEDKSREHVMANAVKPAYFIPENVKADVLFRNMRRNSISLAVVLDEYGGMVGIVTLYDLIEQLVGRLAEKENEESSQSPKILKIDEKTWKIYGNIELAEIEKSTGVIIDDIEYDTFTGLVFKILGRVPQDGPQKIEFEVASLNVCVNKIEEHQVAEAMIHMKESEIEVRQA